MNVRDLTRVALLAALIALCAWLTIPAPVPFTMQTFAIFLAVGVAGGRRGSMAVGLYLLLGAVGLPVFAGFQGGVGSLVGTTGGYLVGFLLMALVMWLGQRLWGEGPAAFFLTGLVGLAVCYLFGTVWFLLLYTRTVGPVSLFGVLGSCVFPFLGPDVLKLILALTLRPRLRRALRL